MGTANVADASAQPRRTGIGVGGTSLRSIESGDGGDGDSPTIRMFLIELWPNRRRTQTEARNRCARTVTQDTIVLPTRPLHDTWMAMREAHDQCLRNPLRVGNTANSDP